MAAVVTPSPAVAATGTYTVLDYTLLSDQVATINDFDMTEGPDWTAATSNAATASSLAAAINTASASTLCTAAAVGAVVTVTAVTPGVAGNSIDLLSSNQLGLSTSGGTLAGGQAIGALGSIAVSGPSMIKSITVASTGSNNTLKVINGATSSATEYDFITGIANKTVVRTYRGGLFLPAGCFVLPGSDVTSVVVEFAHE